MGQGIPATAEDDEVEIERLLAIGRMVGPGDDRAKAAPEVALGRLDLDPALADDIDVLAHEKDLVLPSLQQRGMQAPPGRRPPTVRGGGTPAWC